MNSNTKSLHQPLWSQLVGIVGFFMWAWAATLALQAQTTILSEGFEGDFPGAWSVGDANSSGTPAYWDDVRDDFGGEGARSGSWKGYCAGVGYAGSSANPSYLNSMSAYMSRNINLSGYSSATLTFWYKIPSIESGNYDKLRVYIGSSVIWERSTPQTSWTQVSLNLNAYLGATRTLKFEFYSDGSGTAEGAYLDDILVQGAMASPCVDDGYEPDDTAGQAKAIADGETQNRAICPGDEDWVVFELPVPGGSVVVRTGPRSGYGGGDTELWLYGPNDPGGQVAYNDDANDSRWSQISVQNLVPGRYWIRVRELGNNEAIPGYTLYLDWGSAPCVDNYEPDDMAGTARTISNGLTQNRSICTVGDVDWATFTVGSGGS